MSDNLNMFVRYAVSTGVAFAVGKGWISAPTQGPLIDGLIQLVAWGVAALPPIYAALKISNEPKS